MYKTATLSQVALAYGCCYKTIANQMRRWDVKRRPRGGVNNPAGKGGRRPTGTSEMAVRFSVRRKKAGA